MDVINNDGYRKVQGKVRGDKGVDKADSRWVLFLKRIGRLYDLITLALMDKACILLKS